MLTPQQTEKIIASAITDRKIICVRHSRQKNDLLALFEISVQSVSSLLAKHNIRQDVSDKFFNPDLAFEPEPVFFPASRPHFLR